MRLGATPMKGGYRRPNCLQEKRLRGSELTLPESDSGGLGGKAELP